MDSASSAHMYERICMPRVLSNVRLTIKKTEECSRDSLETVWRDGIVIEEAEYMQDELFRKTGQRTGAIVMDLCGY